MLNFNRADRVPDPKEPAKGALKPAYYEPPAPAPAAAAAPSAGNVARAPGVAPRESAPPSAAAERPLAPERSATPMASPPSPPPATAPAAAPATAVAPGSRLAVGANIKLKGVEISDCDELVIEGLVEATVNSKAMTVERPGSLTGTAIIDVAEVHGEFTGELTARLRLVVHATGRVRGTIRYGKLVVAEGGELSGDIKRLEEATGVPRSEASARPA